MPQSATLICTLGSEPQVVTLTLDLLQAQNTRIQQVQVVHTATSQPPIAAALARLKQEFAQHYNQTPLLQLHPLEVDGQPLEDVDTAEGANATFEKLYALVRAAKLKQQPVHLCVAGGRKTMAVFGMSVAQLLFDEDDHLWHLVSSGPLLAEKRLHAQRGEDVRLIPIPVLLWHQLSPVFSDLHNIDNPYHAAEKIRGLQLHKRLEEARSFVLGALTPAERRVVDLLGRDGLSDNEIGERLTLSPRTAEYHLSRAYDKAKAHWNLNAISRSHLVALLAYYYQTQPQISGNYGRQGGH